MEGLRLTAALEAEVATFCGVAGRLWDRGWAERNGGNITVNVTALLPARAAVGARYRKCALPPAAAGLAFLASGTGERKRDLAKGAGGGIVLVDGEAAGYFVLWSAREEFAVTSEFVSHAEVHADLLARGTGQRAVLHTHATELIALSHVPGYDDEARLTDTLWRTMPEVRVFLPRGVAVVPETLPGSKALADLTVAALRRRDVVLWARHGVLAAGADLEDAFDLIDLANKGADITLRCLAAGQPPVGLSDASLHDLEREFRLR